MSTGQFTYRQLDDSFLNHIRLQVVAQGYYPDLYLYQPQTPTTEIAFKVALDSIKTGGKTPINVVGVGSFINKGEMLLNTIYVHRLSSDKGSVSVYDTGVVRTDNLTTPPNANTTYSKIQTQGYTQNISYEIRFISNNQDNADLISNILHLALTMGRNYFDAYDINTGLIIPDRLLLVEYNGAIDLDVFEYKEYVFRYTVIDAWLVTGDSYPDGVESIDTQSIVPITDIQMDLDVVSSIVPDSNTYSMFFDGLDDYLVHPSSVPFNFDTDQAFTISFWVYKISNTPNLPIISKWVNSIGWFVFALGTGNLRLQLRTGNTSTSIIDAYSIDTLTMDAWNYCTISYDGGKLNSSVGMKINSLSSLITFAQGVSVQSGSMLNNTPVTMGALPSLFLYGTGYINIVNMWNRVLSIQEVNEDYALKGNPTTILNGLMLDLRMGDNAEFIAGNWILPDLLGLSQGFESSGMGLSNRVPFKPN